jgi:hypothetical protein
VRDVVAAIFGYAVRRYAIIDDDLACIAQAAAFALDNEVPQRLARLRDQCAAAGAGVGTGGRRGGVMCGKFAERVFKLAAKSAKRGGNLLRDLVIERGGRVFGGFDKTRLMVTHRGTIGPEATRRSSLLDGLDDLGGGPPADGRKFLFLDDHLVVLR